MSNINTYALPQMKLILGDVSGVNDTVYLPFLQQAVYELNRTLNAGMSVTVSGSVYTLAPAPTATSVIWNVLANGGVLLYHKKLLRDYRDELQGLDSIRDDVTTFSRRTNLQEKRLDVEAQEKAYKKALADYKRLVGDGGSAIDEIALREDS